ncbi:MAG: hypothetical protein ACK41T_00345 [Pseudobdellovibrio sp.]
MDIRKAMPLISLVILVVVSIFIVKDLILNLGIDILEFNGKWESYHRLFYMGALSLAIFSVFKRSPLFIYAPFALICAHLAEYVYSYEGLHEYLVKLNFYHLIGYKEWEGNPQYAGLLLYGVLLFIVFFKLLYYKLKSLNLYFVLMLLLVNILTIFLNHVSFPNGIMKDMYNLHTENLKILTKLDEDQFAEICIDQHIVCRSIDKNGKINQFSFLESEHENYNSYYKRIASNFSYGNEDVKNDYNKMPSVYLNLRSKNLYYEIFSYETPFKIWNLSFEYFSRACFFVSMVWFYLIVLFSYIHRKKIGIM